jgi:sialic acid synthase SpsE
MAPPYILADCSTQWAQDFDRALRFLDAIAEANEQAPIPIVFKGEILWDVDICLPDTGYTEAFWAKDGTPAVEDFRKLIARKVIDLDTYDRILSAAKDRDLDRVMSVYDFIGADFAREHGCALKVASSNITHRPLIRHCATISNTPPPTTGCAWSVLDAFRPLYLDTGRATLAEVDTAIRLATESGATDIRIGHSPDGHPADPVNHNLRSLRTLQTAFGLPVGLSCHRDGEDAAIAAVALGAAFVEVTVSDEPDALEQDAVISLDVNSLVPFANTLHGVHEMLGDSWRDLAKPIERIGSSARMGLVAREAIMAGEVLSLDTVRFAFPVVEHGIPVGSWDHVEGTAVRNYVAKDMPIHWSDLGRRV